MSGRPSQAVILAARLVREHEYTPADAADAHGCAVSSVHRMLNRTRPAGEPARKRGRPRKAGGQ